ncbi:uncharacterized protein TNCV_2686391 [Trichonephila clavipes]|nr:uncharacterized protein TNCV_2686391 [Trichonephila clavipes]
MKVGNNGNLVLGPFDESTPCLMIVLINCQTKLEINHLTAVKSLAILEIHLQKLCGGGDRGRVAIYRPFGEVSLSLNRTVTCMVLKANDRRTSCPCHDEFRGPRSDYVRQRTEGKNNIIRPEIIDELYNNCCGPKGNEKLVIEFGVVMLEHLNTFLDWD